jgi:ketosteroid isomerase-like protein
VVGMSDNTPDIVTRYLAAADAKDPARVGACFAADGTVVDEGRTYTGPAQIQAWREALLGQFTFTTTVTGSASVSPQEHRVHVHVVGDFPGGEVDLTYCFTVRDDLITALVIG